MRFRREPDGSVTSEFLSDAMYQGYSDVLHGGVVAAVLDGAMTNCLFAHNVVAVPAELRQRGEVRAKANAKFRRINGASAAIR